MYLLVCVVLEISIEAPPGGGGGVQCHPSEFENVVSVFIKN